jgi:Flp pilus assembly protein TadD
MTDEMDPSLLDRSTRARELGKPAVAREFLLAWAQERPRDRVTLATLRSRLGRLGYAAEAVEIQREVVAITTGRERLGRELVKLASVCREAGDFDGARQALDECAALTPELGGLATNLRREAERLAEDMKRPGTPQRDPGP